MEERKKIVASSHGECCRSSDIFFFFTCVYSIIILTNSTISEEANRGRMKDGEKNTKRFTSYFALFCVCKVPL